MGMNEVEQGGSVNASNGVSQHVSPKNDGSKKRGFFSRPPIIVLFMVLAFAIGNVSGVTGKIDVRGQAVGSDKNAAAGLPDNLDYTSVEDVYDTLRSKYDGKLTSEQLIAGLKKGLADSTGDPYTEYFTAKEAKEFQGQVNGTFTGIGAELGEDEDGNIIIVSPISGNPAEKAGLRPKDIITTINGETTAGFSIDDAVKKIRGEKGTKVTLQIIRNKSESLSFTIVRDNIQIRSVEYEVLEGNNIGLISIGTFGTDTSALMQEAAAAMKSANVKGIILDLRGNPGGILQTAVDVAGEWLPAGKNVLQEKRGSVLLDSYDSEGPGRLNGIPTVVLINEGSASASEIVAGALKDGGAARLIGEKSYGKGVVQQPICIGGGMTKLGCEGDMLKVTVASWYRPNGQNINKKGITPDQTVKISDADAAAEKDTQKDAAIQYLLTKQ